MNKENKKKLSLIAASILLIIILLSKKNFYNLFNLNINKLNNIEKILVNSTYYFFAFILSINFFLKTKNKSNIKEYLKNCSTSALTIFIYSITSIIEIFILYLIPRNISPITRTITLIITEIAIIILIIKINKKSLQKDFIDIKKNWNSYFTEYLKYYIVALILMTISNYLINIIYPSIAGNEQTIRESMTKAPIYIYFTAVFTAPFMEEMIFRRSIRNIIQDNLTFIITSGLIFGGLHVIGNINNIYDLLYLIPYSIPGFMFAYILTKKDNILIPMGIHFLHNGILMTLQLILVML